MYNVGRCFSMRLIVTASNCSVIFFLCLQVQQMKCKMPVIVSHDFNKDLIE